MRLPLLFGADPKVARFGPKVLLGDGQWRIVTEGVTNSRLGLSHNPPGLGVINGNNLLIDGPREVFVQVIEGGTEEHISVFAERVRDY
jgi:hypothetical protein